MMHGKRSISLSTVVFAAIALLFASGNQQALAADIYGSGFDLGGYCGYCDYGFHNHFYPNHSNYPFELPFP